jgi:energy-coupling factor transporter transmembrane protein EcfT
MYCTEIKAYSFLYSTDKPICLLNLDLAADFHEILRRQHNSSPPRRGRNLIEINDGVRCSRRAGLIAGHLCPVFMWCRMVGIGVHHACWLLLQALFMTASVLTATSTTAITAITSGVEELREEHVVAC